MDRFLKFRLPPRSSESDPNLDRRSVLELTDSAPLPVIAVNIDSSEIHEAETRQWNSRNDGGIQLRTWSPVDRNAHALVGVLGDGGDRALEQSVCLRTL